MAPREVGSGIFRTSWTSEDHHEVPMATFAQLRIGPQDDLSRPIVSHVQLTKDQTIPLHAHEGWTFLTVLGGSFTIVGGDEPYVPGDVRIMEPNIDYELVPGPDGVTFLEFFETSTAMRQPTFANPNDPRLAAQFASPPPPD